MKQVHGDARAPGPLTINSVAVNSLAQPLRLRVPVTSEPTGPFAGRSLLSSERLAPRLLKEDLARIDGYLALHGFGVGDGLRPILDGRLTTLEQVIDAARGLVLPIIPRSDVERYVAGRWNGMVLHALLHPGLPTALIKNVFDPDPPPPPQPPAAITILAPPTGRTTGQAGATLPAFKVKVTQKPGGPIVPDNTPVTWSVSPVEGSLLVPSPGTAGGESTAILTLTPSLNVHAGVSVKVTVSSPGLEPKTITVNVRPKPNISLGTQIAWHASIEGDQPQSPDRTIQLQISEEARFNVDTKQSQILAGAQVTSPELELIEELLKVSAFAQILAGVAWTGSSASGTFMLQPTAGVQLQLTWGPVQITVQVGPGFTTVPGQGTTGDFNVTPFQVTIPF